MTPTHDFHFVDFSAAGHFIKADHPRLTEALASALEAGVFADAVKQAQSEPPTGPGAKAARVEPVNYFLVRVVAQPAVNLGNHLRLGPGYFTVRQWQRQFQGPRGTALKSDLNQELVGLAQRNILQQQPGNTLAVPMGQIRGPPHFGEIRRLGTAQQ